MFEMQNFSKWDGGFCGEGEFLFVKPYLFIKGFATRGGYKNTLRALPLARRMHSGQFRKGMVDVDGQKFRLPYFLHSLKVCSTLISLNLPLIDNELDLLYACALLHDTYEDCAQSFPNGVTGYSTIYGFPKEVGEIIELVSKHPGMSMDELHIHFQKMSKSKLASLIKLADRSHNVEDLYNMKPDKLHKYVNETRECIYPLATEIKTLYPELSNGVTILKSKIVSLTELTETIVELYDEKIEEITMEYESKIAHLEEEHEIRINMLKSGQDMDMGVDENDSSSRKPGVD